MIWFDLRRCDSICCPQVLDLCIAQRARLRSEHCVVASPAAAGADSNASEASAWEADAEVTVAPPPPPPSALLASAAAEAATDDVDGWGGMDVDVDALAAAVGGGAASDDDDEFFDTIEAPEALVVSAPPPQARLRPRAHAAPMGECITVWPRRWGNA